MKNAGELIRSYVLAGFSKIHIDTSMCLADDAPNERLSDVVIAHRGAQLCRMPRKLLPNTVRGTRKPLRRSISSAVRCPSQAAPRKMRTA